MPPSREASEEADRREDATHPRQTPLLIGHADQERDLLDAYRQNRLPHAIVIGGPEGIGKATLAWRLARFVLAYPDRASAEVAQADDLSVRPGSKAAAEVASLSHPDVVLLRREVNEKTGRFFTEIRTDDVRRAIGLFRRGAGAGGYRVVVVDSAEDLNRSGANALLKMIEEPPPLSLFLLVAHRPGLLLPTIRSRSRLLRLQPLQPGDVERVVRTLGAPWTELPDALVSAAAGQSHGSVAEALRILGQNDAGLAAAVRNLLDALPGLDWRAIHRVAEQATGRNGEAAFDLVMAAVDDWVANSVRARAHQPPGRLAPFAEFWEANTARRREAEALNLDKRTVVLSTFADLSAAVRGADA